MVAPREALVRVDLEAVGDVDLETGRALGALRETNENETVSREVSQVKSNLLPRLALAPGALGRDELVAALVDHAHAHLALVALLAQAPGKNERKGLEKKTSC